MLSPRMWEGLPEHLRAGRLDDDPDLGGWTSAWLSEGRITPHHWGPGSQPANTPATTDASFGGTDVSLPIERGSRDLSQPQLRLRDLDAMGIDTSVMYPTTLYATLAADAEVEAGGDGAPNPDNGAAGP